MPRATYIYQQSGKLYFRRRIPKLSTKIAPVLVALGTKSEIEALSWSRTLNQEFETVLDTFTFIIDPIPEDLLHRYLQLRLKKSVSEMRRHASMAWATGRNSVTASPDREALRLALMALIETGPHQPFPVFRINPEWSAEMLTSVVTLFDKEALALKSPEIQRRLAEEFQEATGRAVRSMEHKGQILQVYVNARLASLDLEDNEPAQTTEIFKKLSKVQMVSTEKPMPPSMSQQTSAIELPVPENSVQHVISPTEAAHQLTPGVRLCNGPLTIRVLAEQFNAAQNCEEELHRSPKDAPFGVDFAGVCERTIKIAQADGRMDGKTADARRSRVRLFCLLADVQCVTDVEQHHFRIFERRIGEVHKNFLKSPAHFDFTWSDIKALADQTADEDLGRSPKTFNTFLEQVSAVLKHAKANEAIPVNPDLDPSLLRKVETKRQRSKRQAFSSEETKALFQHPVWHGGKSDTRRHEPGNWVEKDGLYFVPLIVNYTGARMEEIAGLTTDAIVKVGDDYGIDIRPHAERRLKNLQSERLLPVHRHLIELGLLARQQEMKAKGEKFLFPELCPKSAKKKFTSALRYNWAKLREIQLDGNPRGLDGHSLRHSFNQFLKNQEGIDKMVRLDILGHAGEDLNEEVYGDSEGMPFEMKKAAIDLIPNVF